MATKPPTSSGSVHLMVPSLLQTPAFGVTVTEGFFQLTPGWSPPAPLYWSPCEDHHGSNMREIDYLSLTKSLTLTLAHVKRNVLLRPQTYGRVVMFVGRYLLDMRPCHKCGVLAAEPTPKFAPTSMAKLRNAVGKFQQEMSDVPTCLARNSPSATQELS